MDRGSRTKLAAGGLMAAVFGSGVLLGVAADRRVEARSVVEPASASPTEPAPAGRSRREGREDRPRVWEQVDPTVEQAALIDSIFRVHRERMNELDREYRAARKEYRASYDAVIQDTRDAIAGVFTPEQATEYRRLLVEFDARREAERAGRRDRK